MAMLKFLNIFMLVAVVHCRKNVLFIIVDDLRAELNAWMGPDYPVIESPPMITPNIDALAARSLQLTRAYNQYAVCSPSRTSMLTGRRPDTTKVFNLQDHWRDMGGNFTSLPQYFKDNGYNTIGIGKVYHPGAATQDPISWSEDMYRPPLNDWDDKGASWISVDPSVEEARPLQDVDAVNYAKETLERIAPDAISGEQPFFVAVGLVKPHLPFTCPSRFFDLYPPESIKFPANQFGTENLPEIAYHTFPEFRNYQDVSNVNFTGEFNVTLDPQLTLELRRAYYACVSFIDELTGELVEKVDELGLSNNTIIAFVGDHGFHLGESCYWVKDNVFEQSAQTPMMIHVPGVTDSGIKTNAFAELVDFFPTLTEAAGLDVPPLCPLNSTDVKVCTEGWSLLPLALNASAGKTAAFSQIRAKPPNTKYMGYSVRTDTYRYTEWPQYDRTSEDPQDWVIDWDDVQGYELYDHSLDKEENFNRVAEAEYESIAAELSVLLRNGWRSVIPN